MISVASYMSVTSDTNPYLNSNLLNDKNQHIEKNTTIYNNSHNSSQLSSKADASKMFKFSESGFEDTLDPDNIDNYLKLHSNNIKFESIAHNFNSSADSTLTNNTSNSTSVGKADFQENFLKMFDANTQTKTNGSGSIAVNKHGVEKENKENQQQNVPVVMAKSQPPQKQAANTLKNAASPVATLPNLPAKKQAPSVTIEVKSPPPSLALDEKNPFLSLENTNETIIKQNVDESKYNPFLESPTKSPLDFESEAIITSPPQLESTVKCFSKDDEVQETTANKQDFVMSNTSKDLLEWCKDIVKKSKGYSPLFKSLTISDFSTSWTNGLAFCAIIYHFRPNLM